jgi:ectoine hydroxylase-related dioxygenase (phytanoyl-CoA dioxygenase family)
MTTLTEDQVQEHVEAIARDGFSIMRNAIDPEFLQELKEELERLERVRPGGDVPPAPFTGQVTRRWFDVLNDSEIWQRVAVHPWIMQVVPQVLGQGFLLSTMGSAVVGSGEPAQPFHADDTIYAFPRPHPNLVCNTMWALSDFTEEAGATQVVPGSNRWDDDPDLSKEYDSVPLEMPAGSICFLVGTCYHGAGHNRSGADRVALTINYCSGAMRQQENLMLGLHPARLMGFSEELQDLLGFKLYNGAGHIFAQDPRTEMVRHYGNQAADDPYLERRNDLHKERTGQ